MAFFVVLQMIVSIVSSMGIEIELFVSSNAIYSSGCGNFSHPCPTLFDVSIQIESLTQSNERITVYIDGQNIIESEQRNTSWNGHLYNPCLLLPIDHPTARLDIIFNTTTIHQLEDWFPPICSKSSSYHNEYMFDNTHLIRIHNLIMNDYSMDKLGLVRSRASPFLSGKYIDGTIYCIRCTFINITSTTDRPFFLSRYEVSLVRTEFRDFDTKSNIICCYRPETGYIQILMSEFINISSSTSLIELHDGEYNELIRIQYSVFYNVSTAFYLVLDKTVSEDVYSNGGITRIEDTTIHMRAGSIYHSYHMFPASMSISNVFITIVVHEEPDTKPIFFFTSTDAVDIFNMTVFYSFDTNKLCDIDTYENMYKYHGMDKNTNSSCLGIWCHNPPSLIINEGKLAMDYVTIDSTAINPTSNDPCIQYYYARGNGISAFINNKRDMFIYNMFVTRSISHVFLHNEGYLEANQLHFDAIVNLNALHSDTIIRQRIDDTHLSIWNSTFYGSRIQIQAFGGQTVFISHCVFANSHSALVVEYVHMFTLTHSVVQNHGWFHAMFLSTDDDLSTPSAVANIKNADYVAINDTVFSGHNDGGVIAIYDTDEIILERNWISNIFNETASLYNASQMYRKALSGVSIIGIARHSSLVTLTHNHFTAHHDLTDAVSVHECTVCISGNVFSNFQLDASGANITSCFRSELMNCLGTNECMNGIYGFIDPSYANDVNTFMADTPFTSMIDYGLHGYGYMFIARASWIALDNVQFIHNISHTSAHISDAVFKIHLSYSKLLLVDSYIQPTEISYSNCTVMHYDRLQSDINYVSRLLVDCSMNNATTVSDRESMDYTLVSHLSVVQLNVTTKSLWYYPGDLLTFEYHATDKLGHVINDTKSINAVIHLETDSFLGTLNIEKNACINCGIGLLLTDVSLHHIGSKYDMRVWIPNNQFIAVYSTLSVTIIGCPMGFSPDLNHFHCQACGNGYYNLLPNSSDQCGSCNPTDNNGIECGSGSITIAYNHWMGFDSQHNIVSARCSSRYCCTKREGCDYINNKDALCTSNRNYSSVLCGQCNDEFSESITTTHCVRCDTSGSLQYLLLPLCFSFLCAMLVLRVDPKEHCGDGREQSQTGVKDVMRSDYFKLMVKSMLFKCVIYYEQGVSDVVIGNTISPFFALFASIFNLSPIMNTNVFGDICLMDGMNGKHKILMDLCVPVMLPIFVMVFYSNAKYIIRQPMILRGRRVHFGKTFLTLFVLMIGKILDVLFKLLSCVTVGNRSVHFYFAYEECYGVTWVSSLIVLISIITGFAVLFVKLKRMTLRQRQNRMHALFVFTSRYKQEFYWWEFVIFLRRVIIAWYHALVEDMTLRLAFVSIIIFCMYLQHTYNPFVIEEANQVEFILLCCFLFIVLSQFPSITFQLNEWVISVVISILVILPIPLFVYYVVTVIKNRTAKQEVPDYEDEDENDYDVSLASPRANVDVQMAHRINPTRLIT
eukprot:163702_1